MQRKRVISQEDFYIHRNAKRTAQFYDFINKHGYAPPYYCKREERYLTNQEFYELQQVPVRHEIAIAGDSWLGYFEGIDGNCYWYISDYVLPDSHCYRCGKVAYEHRTRKTTVASRYPEDEYVCPVIGYYVHFNCFDHQIGKCTLSGTNYEDLIYEEPREMYSFLKTQ